MLLISFTIFIIRYRKKKSKNINNNQINAIWSAPVNGKYIYLSEGEAINDSQIGEIFSLENNENLNCFKDRSSFMQEDLTDLTLARR